ncbi:MAG: TetR/AcrR family transcriptional regulator [Lachnospiraceae bacterium]|nr:TetR/AcrR family transcriptional regulator [Lachnospiraceae bacterium]MDD7334736.1 TetR/AcrR family transcriptional regulator [Lachnospiraceae bacterium]MDY3275509.1 TetR/AcrR family transcriptional regulator [Agathobacter sp.]MDY5520588.1 TetR/AcrR family transcriptional regulator [Agathobacter sp.]
MSNGFTLEQFINPPKKARLMFEAVIGYVHEKIDPGSLTVQDITARAGVGKGTAYEYFSSKEELIALALFFDYGLRILELQELLEKKKNFEEKMLGLLDWLHDNKSYHMTFVKMIQISAGDEGVCQMLQTRIPQDVFDGMHSYLMEEGDALMEEGYEQGYFAETDKVKRRLALAGMVVNLVLTLHGDEKKESSFFIMDYKDMRQYAYTTLIKTLS